MENNKEENIITLEQAKNIIKSDVDNTIKDWVKSQYDDIELLGLTNFVKEFEELFLDILDYTKDDKRIIYYNEKGYIVNLPTNRIKIRDSEDLWLFSIDYTLEKPHFYYSLNNFSPIFTDKFNFTFSTIEMNTLIRNTFKKNNVLTNAIIEWL